MLAEGVSTVTKTSASRGPNQAVGTEPKVSAESLSSSPQSNAIQQACLFLKALPEELFLSWSIVRVSVLSCELLSGETTHILFYDGIGNATSIFTLAH